MKKQLIALMAGLCAAATTNAAFVLYEDFQGYTADSALSGQGIWEGGGNVTVRDDAGNQYAEFDGGQSSASFVNSTTAIDTANKTTTVFFRAYLPNNVVTPGNLTAANNLGLRDASLSNSFGNNRNQVALQDSVEDGSWDPSLTARDGAATVTELISDNTWYNLWIVSDTVANTWSLYMTTGTNGADTSDLLGASFKGMAFRNTTETGSIEFVLGNAAINEVTNGGRVDDIYVDVGNANLSYAIPEPGSLALVGLAIGALVFVRRRG